jgi:hypothetical protein
MPPDWSVGGGASDPSHQTCRPSSPARVRSNMGNCRVWSGHDTPEVVAALEHAEFGGFGLGRRSPHCVAIAPEPSAANRSRREAVTKRWAARG